ncbi:MAG TPA: GAP family protein, partial [Pseudonocardia sp.]|nr:GAP family protein [Pseudonocardia sp.]
ALILLLPGPRPVLTALAFVLGAYLVVLGGGALAYLAADAAAGAVTGGLVWVRRIAFGLAAVALLLAAVRRLRPYRRGAIALPSWVAPLTAPVLGVVVTAADLPNAFPYFVAIERLVSAAVPVPLALLVLAGYSVVYCLPCLLLVAAGAAGGDRVRRRLDPLYRRFGTERDVPRNVPVALGLAALAAGVAGVAVAA